jgi:hypothetical protein
LKEQPASNLLPISPNETFHLGSEDNIDLVPFNELDQPLEIEALFFGIRRCADIILLEDGHDPSLQDAILDVTPGLLETFGNLN